MADEPFLTSEPFEVSRGRIEHGESGWSGSAVQPSRDVFLLWHENGALLGIYAHEASAKAEQAHIAGTRIQKRLVG